MSYRLFQYRIPAPEDLPELNGFLSAHRIVSVRQELAHRGDTTWLVFSVEYVPSSGAPEAGGEVAKTARAPKIDYRDVLNDEQFARFSRLRDWRKSVADADGVPVYTLFTNAQLSEMVIREVRSAGDLRGIPGVGAAKVERHGAKVLEILTGQ